MKPQKRTSNWYKRISLALGLSLMNATAIVHADEIASSKLGKGLDKLLGDAQGWLLGLVSVIGAVCLIYFFIRKQTADDHEQQKWQHRIVTTFVCVGGGLLATALIGIIKTYFG